MTPTRQAAWHTLRKLTYSAASRAGVPGVTARDGTYCAVTEISTLVLTAISYDAVLANTAMLACDTIFTENISRSPSDLSGECGIAPTPERYLRRTGDNGDCQLPNCQLSPWMLMQWQQQ